MAHTAPWPSKFFFYPIGNTPAVCFTSDLPPEQPANILLLGCGDVRNVLCTVYADLGAPTRNLDFTCCDLEPAVLARNVLLYTLIADLPEQNVDKHISRMWNLYYHFFIDKSTLDVLLKQCQRLLDVSIDLPVWNSSKYGSFIRFCDVHTLSSLRRHWVLYIETENFSKDEKDSLRERFRTDSRKLERPTQFILTRSAGPLWTKLPRDLATKHFHHYWETGIVIEDAEDVAAANLINPTFAYSMMGLGFELHYASDPLLSFHLAEALAPVKGNDPKKSVVSASLIKSAMSQFRGWCQAFRARLRSVNSTFVVRFFVGDALAFCRALRYCAISDDVNTGLYASPWSTVLINLERGDYTRTSSCCAPLQFNVIDTSNLTDHVGLLNILPVCKPLMQRSPSSILHTNALHRHNESDSDFLEGLCGDVSILSIILDLIPISYASNFTTSCNMHEVVSGVQIHERLSWRIGAMSDSHIVQTPVNHQRLNFDEKQLATFLYDVYLKMFSEENPLLHFSAWTNTMKKSSPFNYVRFSFAYLLRVVKDQVHLDWESFVGHLHDMIGFNRSLVTGLVNIQDLFCAFHMLGVHSFPPFIADVNDSLTREKVFHGWKDIPTVVCITFQVPRRKFDCLGNPDWVGTPILYCAFSSNTKHNAFQNYQSFFGCVRADYRANPPSIAIDEDSKGLRGSSPVVFTFYVPTWVLGVESSSLKVIIGVRPSPFVVGKLVPILGLKLEIFSAKITDRNHVHVTRERPGNLGELQKIRKISFTQPISSIASLGSDAIKLHLDSDGKKLVTLTNRASVVDAAAKVALLINKATVSVHQISSHAMSVTFGKHRYVIPYPFPIDSTSSKTRIARKSHYVEVELKLSNPTIQTFGMSMNPFPIIKYNGLLHLWNIHYIDLDQLPTLDLSREKRFDFVPPHVGMAYSDRERRLREASMGRRLEGSDVDVMADVKETIHQLFVTICEQKSRVFGLADPHNGGTYTLIFVNDMRLDLAANAVVVDAVVLPLTEDLVERLHVHIGRLHAAGIVTIKTRQDEVRAWKHLLPAFTERCRKWKHTLNCKYVTKGVPVSEEMEQSPLCECGSGKDLGPFIKNKDWKAFAPHSSRIAISPLFAVPFIDTIGKSWLEDAVERADINACARCGGPGKPKLLFCGACKKTVYCSAECQKEDWKSHKKQCKKP